MVLFRKIEMSRSSVFCLFLLIFGSFGIVSSNITAQSSQDLIIGDQLSSDYIDLNSALSCSSDACFTSTLKTQIENAGGQLLGAGTASDPYIIENFNISNSGGFGISLNGITKHVLIRQNKILGIYGISLYNVAGVITIENNNITSSGTVGIWARRVNSTLIVKDNYFHDIKASGGWALELGNSNPGLGDGVMNSSRVYNNTFVGNYRAIGAYYTNNTHIYNNTILDTQFYAMEATHNDILTINNNTIMQAAGGIRFTFTNNHTIAENNTIHHISDYLALGDNYYDQPTPRFIRYNHIENASYGAIGGGNNATITNNVVIDSGGTAISSGHNSTIDYNTIDGYGSLFAFSYGIYAGWDTKVVNNIVSGKGTGIFVGKDALVQDNHVSDVMGNGISITEGIITAIGNSIVNASDNGINVQNAYDGSLISSNTIQDVKQNGVSVRYSKNAVIEDNNIINSGGSGIYLESTSGNEINSNTVSGSVLFAVNSLSSPSIFHDNVFENEIAINYDTSFTLSLDVFTSYEFTNNTVHGLPFGYYINPSSDITTQHGQLYIIDADAITVTNNDFLNWQIPITVAFSTNTILQGLTLTNNSFYSVRIIGSTSVVGLVDAKIKETHGTAIWSEGTLNMHDSEITDNFGDGLHIGGYSKINDNVISRNDGIGILIDATSNGVQVYDNLFEDNQGYAVAIQAPSFGTANQNAKIHHNNFIDNNIGGTSQALDNGSNNQWYDFNLNEGNYWNDWSGTGSYEIDGTASNQDLYPLGNLISLPRTTSTTTSTSDTSSTTSTTSDTGPTSTDSKDTSEPNEANPLPTPSVNFVLLFLASLFVSTVRKNKRKQVKV